jgi:vacuolar iron transporter family protein
MKDTVEISRFRENWQDEVDSAAEYSALAAVEPEPKIAAVYSNLAKMEEAHISFWEERLRRVGAPLGRRKPSWRSRVLRWIARRFGPETVISTIAAKETASRNVYANQAETRGTRMHSPEASAAAF